jgi:hypothetical protein
MESQSLRGFDNLLEISDRMGPVRPLTAHRDAVVNLRVLDADAQVDIPDWQVSSRGTRPNRL